MDTKQSMTEQFHRAFGHPVGEFPQLPTLDEVQRRAKWLREEIDEMVEAVEDGDIVKFYDSLVDIDYLNNGTATITCLDLEAGFPVVHGANMAKLDGEGNPIYAPDGKIMKPEGWVPPEEKLEVLIVKQMEDGRIFALAKAAAAAYTGGEELTLPKLSPGDIVKVTQGVSLILQATDPDAHERWAEEFGS